MASLKVMLLEELKKRKSSGIRQNELTSIFRYSRSHISETVGAMEKEGEVIRRKEGKATNRIWLTDYFPSQIEHVLRVGILRSSEYVPFLSLLHENLSDKYRIIVSIYDDASEVISSLHAGILEIAMAPTFTHILYSITTKKEVIVSTVSYGGSSLLRNRISENDVLATSESSTMALISRDLVRDSGVVVYFFSDPRDAVEKFLAGEYRYLAIWEPYLSFLLSKENVEDISDEASDKFLAPCCSVGVNRDFMDSNSELVSGLISGYGKFLSDLDPKKMDFGLTVVADATGFSKREVLESLKSYRFESGIDADTLSKYMINVGLPMSASRIREMILS